ncbi:MAG: hypothetical protein K6B44_09605 [Lachnospiraceae bacterium]|nr:hypothetical protein [Lachnospiraceae bacterium]
MCEESDRARGTGLCMSSKTLENEPGGVASEWLFVVMQGFLWYHGRRSFKNKHG